MDKPRNAAEQCKSGKRLDFLLSLPVYPN